MTPPFLITSCFVQTRSPRSVKLKNCDNLTNCLCSISVNPLALPQVLCHQVINPIGNKYKTKASLLLRAQPLYEVYWPSVHLNKFSRITCGSLWSHYTMMETRKFAQLGWRICAAIRLKDLLWSQEAILREKTRELLSLYQENQPWQASPEKPTWNIPLPFSFYVILETILRWIFHAQNHAVSIQLRISTQVDHRLIYHSILPGFGCCL